MAGKHYGISRYQERSKFTKQEQASEKEVLDLVEGFRQKLDQVVLLLNEVIGAEADEEVNTKVINELKLIRDQLKFFQLVLKKDNGSSRKRLRRKLVEVMDQINSLKKELELNKRPVEHRKRANSNRRIMLVLTFLSTILAACTAMPRVDPTNPENNSPNIEPPIEYPQNTESNWIPTPPQENLDEPLVPDIKKVVEKNSEVTNPRIVAEVQELKDILEFQKTLQEIGILSNSTTVDLGEYGVQTWFDTTYSERGENPTTTYPEWLIDNFIGAIDEIKEKTEVDLRDYPFADIYRSPEYDNGAHSYGAFDLNQDIPNIVRELESLNGQLYWRVYISGVDITEIFTKYGFQRIPVQNFNGSADEFLKSVKGKSQSEVDKMLLSYVAIYSDLEWWHFEPDQVYQIMNELFGTPISIHEMSYSQYQVGKILSLIIMYGEDFPGSENVDQKHLEVAKEIYLLLQEVQSNNISEEEFDSSTEEIGEVILNDE